MRHLSIERGNCRGNDAGDLTEGCPTSGGSTVTGPMVRTLRSTVVRCNHAHARNLGRRAVEPVDAFQDDLLNRRAGGAVGLIRGAQPGDRRFEQAQRRVCSNCLNAGPFITSEP